MKENETPKPPERLSEELQRQDWLERVAILNANLDFVNQEIEEQQLRDLEREEQGLPPRESPPPYLAHLASELELGAEPMLNGPIPLFIRLSPERQKAALEEWARLQGKPTR